MVYIVIGCPSRLIFSFQIQTRAMIFLWVVRMPLIGSVSDIKNSRRYSKFCFSGLNFSYLNRDLLKQEGGISFFIEFTAFSGCSQIQDT